MEPSEARESEAREEAHGVISAGVEPVEGDDLSSVGMSSSSTSIDRSNASVVSELSNRSGHSYGGVTPLSQRSAGSVARHHASEAVKVQAALAAAREEASESARKVAALEYDWQQAAELSEQATLAAAREEKSARKAAGLGMGVPDGVI